MSDLRKKFEHDIKEFTAHISADEFDYTINISLRHKYVYVENAKVACSSIKLILQRMELDDTDYHGEDLLDIHTRIYSPMIRPAQVGSFSAFVSRSNVTKFCFVRNPYTRLLSAYLDKIVNNMPAKIEVLQALGSDGENINRMVSFTEFVDVVERQTIAEMNPHWRIQYYQTFQEQIEYDFIGRFESLDQDLKKILVKVNLDFQRYWGREERHATNSEESLNRYYTSDLEAKVFGIYKKDFDEFGYSRFKINS